MPTHGSLIFIRVLRIYNVLYFLLLEGLSIFLIVFSGLLSAKWAVVHNTIEPALKVLCSSKLNFQFLEMNFKNERTVRCRAHARMIKVKTSRGEKFFANEGKNAITSQLDIMPEGGMTVISARIGCTS